MDFVLGTQYFRYPTPRAESWDADLARIRQLGMSVVKIFICWAEVEVEPGRFEFAIFDKLFDAVDRAGLRVVPNLGWYLDVPPWFRRANPHSNDLDDNAFFQGYTRFVAQTVRRYAGRPSLLVWDCWNEPQISLSDGRGAMNRYRVWLEAKYGSPKACAEAWGVPHLAGWDQVARPNLRQLPESLDFYRFNRQHLPELFEQLAAVYRQYDPDHPVMTHDVFTGVTRTPPYHDGMNLAPLDLHGVSLHIPQTDFEHPRHAAEYCHFGFALNVKASLATRAGKPLWVSELFGGAQVLSMPSPSMPHPQTVRTNLWECVARGASGILFWQYRPERFTFSWCEDAGWGLTDLAGGPTERTAVVEEFARQIAPLVPDLPLRPAERPRVAIVINDLSSFISRHRRRPAELAYGYGEFARLEVDDPYEAAVIGAYRAFQRCNVPVEVVCDDTPFDGYELIYFPLPLQMEPQTANRIRLFVEQGGRAVLETAAGLYGPDGWISEVAPSSGLDELFGVREGDWVSHPADRSYEEQGHRVPVAFRTARLVVQGATVAAAFDDGSPAKTVRNAGAGQAVYLASSPSLGLYALPQDDGAGLIRTLGLEPRPLPGPVELVRAVGKVCYVVFAFNRGGAEAAVCVPRATDGKPVVLRGTVEMGQDDIHCRIPAHDVAVLMTR